MSAHFELFKPAARGARAIDVTELRFLVVEDHGFQRWVLGNLLATLGAKHVFSASDGQAALEISRNTEPPIDIIVSDLDMPGMDGMEFIRHVGQVGQPISLILASGLDRSLISSVETMARAYGLTILGAIEKPPTAKRLKAAIDLHVPARANRSSAASSAFTIAEIMRGVKDNEFEPFFQPKVELETRRVKGAEAVARWRHPAKGVIGPQEFIQPLEDAGLLDGLTEMILEKAAACCRIWQNGGLEASVSVNLSLKSLIDVGLADRMMQISHGQGVQPRHLIFEVTESAAATDLGRALENLSRLRMKGFGLS